MSDANFNDSPQGVKVSDKFGNPIKIGDTVYASNTLGESRIQGQVRIRIPIRSQRINSLAVCIAANV